jgi:hypothetical protein
MKNTIRVLLLVACALPAAARAAEAPLSHEEIKSTVDKHLADVKACMKQHGAATGKLVVKFGITPLGKVIDAAPETNSSNVALDKCIAKAFLGWEFPKPRGGVTMGVVYPFMFSAPPPASTLTDAQVVDTIKAHIADVRGCYDAALKQKADLAGTVNVSFSVGPDGKVIDAQLKDSTFKLPALETCIVNKAKTWPFPKPAGAGNFNFVWPFKLVPPPKPDKKEKKDDEEGGEQ